MEIQKMCGNNWNWLMRYNSFICAAASINYVNGVYGRWYMNTMFTCVICDKITCFFLLRKKKHWNRKLKCMEFIVHVTHYMLFAYNFFSFLFFFFLAAAVTCTQPLLSDLFYNDTIFRLFLSLSSCVVCVVPSICQGSLHSAKLVRFYFTEHQSLGSFAFIHMAIQLPGMWCFFCILRRNITRIAVHICGDTVENG